MELGKVTKQADGYQVRFERMLPHPIEKVWDALTNTELLKMWFTDIEMDFRPGGQITFRFRDEAKTASYGQIVKIEPPHLFVFTWEGELANWELFREGKSKCRLVLTYSKLSEQYAANAPAGFHSLLDRLSAMLDGEQKFYPFGTEENDPEHKKIQALYGMQLHKDYPELDKVKPVVVEKTFNAPVKKVWQAITKKEQLREWYFDLDDFKPEVGFEFSFAGKGHKGEDYLHRCKVTEVIPGKKLQYSWQYENIPGYSLVTLELIEQNDRTTLKLTHHGLETFPQDKEDFSKKSFNGGWTELITRLLKEHLEKVDA